MVPDLTRRRRMLVLAICCMSLFIVGLDNTILNVALPSIRDDLGSSLSGLQWTIDAYTLVLASLLMLAGRPPTGSAAGGSSRPGWCSSALGSLLCSLAPSLGWLIAFRMLQAVGGSMLNPVAMSIITNTFTDRARACPGDRRVGRAWSACRWRSARWSAGCWWTRSAGGRSSGSTCRSWLAASC